MNIRLTKKRLQILNVLKKEHGTLSAAAISKKLPAIDLVTIYRNLDLFVQEKLIKKIHLGSGEAQYEYQAEPHHHAVCTNCQKVIHFSASDPQLKKLLALGTFKIDEIDITIKGVCCLKK